MTLKIKFLGIEWASVELKLEEQASVDPTTITTPEKPTAQKIANKLDDLVDRGIGWVSTEWVRRGMRK